LDPAAVEKLQSDILAVLTESQRMAWAQMIGKKIDLRR
jgi:hypothetical protein